VISRHDVEHVARLARLALGDAEPRPCLSQDEALANAPDRSDAFFRVPRIIEDS
jgi:Asp-tRNA(Asn)/Glu-tRNA(Gln) amidotransferase C subunit